jgi:hypothetical protein
LITQHFHFFNKNLGDKMNLPNRQIKKQIGIVGTIFSSLLLAFPAVAQMSPATPGNMNQMPGNQMPGNMNQMPGNQMPEVEGLSPAERSRMCAAYMNSTMRDRQNIPSTINQNIPSQNTDQPASITQTLPSGSVSEPPAVRDGRFPAPTAAEMEQICANEMMQQNRQGFSTPNTLPTLGQNYPTRQTYPSSTPRTIIPTPEQQQAATTSVRPINGTVNLRLINESGANITYQVIGETQPRTLLGEDQITLRSIDTPSTVTFYRPDRGLLTVRPQQVAPGVLEVRFNPTTNFNMDKTTMTVQPSGAVYLN